MFAFNFKKMELLVSESNFVQVFNMLVLGAQNEGSNATFMNGLLELKVTKNYHIITYHQHNNIMFKLFTDAVECGDIVSRFVDALASSHTNI